ncbi:putative adenylyl-sulfate kinase [groundwater metagenome]|uniref:Putative adenylyl-sulfate kinase n=1 Tax=groundwater metagenome TaxID=717931 RepID=A0A098E8Y8_9ZZZZ
MFCVWLTGIPGSGKSTIAKELADELKNKNINVQILRLDEIRKIVTPNPDYSEKERDIVYRALAMMAKFLYDNKINVIIDATANKRDYRNLARNLMKNFFEIYVICPADVAGRRESSRVQNLVQKDLYKKAKEGKIQLPGINAVYEEPENPELIIDSEKISPKDAAAMIIKVLNL